MAITTAMLESAEQLGFRQGLLNTQQTPPTEASSDEIRMWEAGVRAGKRARAKNARRRSR